MAVHTLHQTFVDAVVIRFGKVCLSGDVASVTQLGLLLDQQELFFFGVMGRVAIETSDIAAGVRGFGEMRLRACFAVAGQTASASLLPRLPLEHEYFRLVAAACHVVRSGTMATLTTLLRRTALRV